MPLASQLLRTIGCILLIFWISASTKASELPPFLSEDGFHFVLEHGLISAGSRENYLAKKQATLTRFDQDQNGLDEEDIAIVDIIQRASKRAERFRKIFVHDLNNDGLVHRSEIELSSRERRGLPLYGPLGQQSLQFLLPKIGEVMQFDHDEDGIVTQSEAVKGPKWDYLHRRDYVAIYPRSILALDPNKDGRLTADELAKMAEETFNYYDANGNNMMDRNEIRRLMQKSMNAQVLLRRECNFPHPSSNEQVILLGIYKGADASAFSATAMTEETTTGRIVIEPGKKSLYIIASSSRPTIWQFEGKTDRVSRAFVLAPFVKHAPGTGISGLKKEKITFVRPRTCFNAFKSTMSKAAVYARAAVENAIGRPVDRLIGVKELRRLGLPSGASLSASVHIGRQPKKERDGEWFDIIRSKTKYDTKPDPANIIAPGPIYRLAPQAVDELRGK